MPFFYNTNPKFGENIVTQEESIEHLWNQCKQKVNPNQKEEFYDSIVEFDHNYNQDEIADAIIDGVPPKIIAQALKKQYDKTSDAVIIDPLWVVANDNNDFQKHNNKKTLIEQWIDGIKSAEMFNQSFYTQFEVFKLAVDKDGDVIRVMAQDYSVPVHPNEPKCNQHNHKWIEVSTIGKNTKYICKHCQHTKTVDNEYQCHTTGLQQLTQITYY